VKLELRGITKRFGSLVANDRIDLTVNPGEIHCLLGENGAGKSTLMNVLYGMLQPDEGEILIDDEAATIHGPGDAVAAGIGMVHQHFMLVPVFTVAENVMLGYEFTRQLGVLDRAAARDQVLALSSRFGFDVDPDAMVEDLPVGVQQRVEIIKALSRDAQVLILDEPTAVLTPQETDDLMRIMRGLAEDGTSIVFITHKLREVRAVADRITVIRRGAVVGEASPQTTESDLAAMMVGRTVELTVDKEPMQPGSATLAIDNLYVMDRAGRALVDDVSFDVHAGEIVAVAGVQGNGQTELVEAIMGLTEHVVTGSVMLDGTELLGQDTARVLDHVGYVPEDRSNDGLVSSFSLAENLVLDQVSTSTYSSRGALRRDVIKDVSTTLVDQFDVRTQGIEYPASSLSGGNQQKLVMARALSRPIDLLLASQPTRGVDVGSIEFLHSRMVAERDAGTAVLIVSTELDEVLALADRIVVMFRGHVVGVVGPDTSRHVLGLMMAGVPHDEAVVQARPDDLDHHHPVVDGGAL
jgi:general nucleoside transport system ATP-binding protein